MDGYEGAEREKTPGQDLELWTWRVMPERHSWPGVFLFLPLRRQWTVTLTFICVPYIWMVPCICQYVTDKPHVSFSSNDICITYKCINLFCWERTNGIYLSHTDRQMGTIPTQDHGADGLVLVQHDYLWQCNSFFLKEYVCLADPQLCHSVTYWSNTWAILYVIHIPLTVYMKDDLCIEFTEGSILLKTIW